MLTDSSDCDNSNDAVFPGAPELEDRLDNNCDGVDETGDEVPTNLDSGCSCTLAKSGGSSKHAWLMALLLAVVGLRRRRS